jgi:hypothetical protein
MTDDVQLIQWALSRLNKLQLFNGASMKINNQDTDRHDAGIYSRELNISELKSSGVLLLEHLDDDESKVVPGDIRSHDILHFFCQIHCNKKQFCNAELLEKERILCENYNFSVWIYQLLAKVTYSYLSNFNGF